MNDQPGASSDHRHLASIRIMSTARNILFALICASPVLLVWDGLIVHGVLAGIVAVALVITARNLRPNETDFLISISRTLIIVAAIPALWVLLQVLPLGLLVHPIWATAEKALGHPVHGAISVDPGISLIALGQYLSMCAVAFVSTAVAVDRHRAEWILFALAAATAAIALIVLIDDLISTGLGLSQLSRAQAIDCASIGTIVAAAVCIRAVERYETHPLTSRQSASFLLWIFAGSIAAFMICVAALVLNATYWTIFASGCGLAAFVCVWVIRRFGLGLWGRTAIIVPILGVALLAMVNYLPQRSANLPLALAESSVALKTLTQRMLDDAPLLGTGAGTFAALAPIYRDLDEPAPGPVAATTATTFAIELGKPMSWLIALAVAAFIIFLLKASLRRGRDSFYAAMGGGCLIATLLTALANAGFLRTATGLIVAATLGLAFAQSKSRTAQL